LQEIAYIYQCSGEFRRAAGYYEKILDKEPKNLEALLQLIRISMDLSDLKYGETFIQTALSEYPQVMEVHELIGLFYVSFQDYEKASHHFDCCQTNGHLTGGVSLGRSQCYLNMQRFEDAVALLKEGMEDFSDYADLQLNLARALIGLEKWEEAGQVLALTRDRFASNINGWYLSVRVAVHFSDYQKAARYWEKLATLQPRERSEYVPYLKSLIFLRKPDVAMKLLKNFTRYRFKEFDSLLLESLIHIQKRNRFHFGISWQELWAAHTAKIQDVTGEIRSLLSKEDIGFMMQLQPEISRLFAKKEEVRSGIKAFFLELTGR
jgi:tetratricopeptide (TPR) repeat protein